MSVQTKTVLVVEDSRDTLQVLAETLWRDGHRVVTAINGEEAVDIARRARPNLIVMDLNMPIMDGLEATRRIHRSPTLGDIPIVAITAYDTYGMEEAAREAGCVAYLRKPIDFEQLEKTVASLLNA